MEKLKIGVRQQKNVYVVMINLKEIGTTDQQTILSTTCLLNDTHLL